MVTTATQYSQTPAHPKRPLAGGPGAPRTGELRLQSAPASLDPEQPPPLSWPAHLASVEPVSDLLPRGRADPRPWISNEMPDEGSEANTQEPRHLRADRRRHRASEEPSPLLGTFPR